MKSIWRGSVSFALLSIPVKAYGATRSKSVSFHLLHKKCSTPLNYERHCASCKAIVPWEDAVHGYEYEKGRFVTLTAQELAKIPVETAKSIDILRFVEIDEIEPIYYEKAYYLEPEQGGERAYALLLETMKSSGKAALAKVAFKEKEHVSVIRPRGPALVLHTLYYADEVVATDALSLPSKIRPDPKELNLASELIKKFVGKFNIEAYHDEYRDALMGVIKSKISGHEIKAPPKREAAKVVSLMDALKKSIQKEEKRKAG